MRVAVADSQEFAVPRIRVRKSRLGLWVGAAAVLIAAYLAVTVWLPYRQMQVSVAEIARMGGHVTTRRDASWLRRVSQNLGYDSNVFLRVEEIDLADTPIADVDLQQLPALASARAINLAGTAISDNALNALSNSRDLVMLDLRNTRISSAGLSRFARLDRLEHLDLSGTAIDDSAMHHLRAFPMLKHLSLAETNITPAGLREISELPLATLNIDAALLTPETVPEIRKWSTLYGLGLYSDRDGDAALGSLSEMGGLTHLCLVGRGFTDAGSSQLEALRGLKNLSLEGTAISSAAAERLRQSRPDCDIEHVNR